MQGFLTYWIICLSSRHHFCLLSWVNAERWTLNISLLAQISTPGTVVCRNKYWLILTIFAIEYSTGEYGSKGKDKNIWAAQLGLQYLTRGYRRCFNGWKSACRTLYTGEAFYQASWNISLVYCYTIIYHRRNKKIAVKRCYKQTQGHIITQKIWICQSSTSTNCTCCRISSLPGGAVLITRSTWLAGRHWEDSI